jgi:hypothetical protein
VSGRSWTIDELIALEEGYGSVPIHELARRLNRTVAAIRMAAYLYGFAQEHRYCTREDEASIRQLNAEGMSDTEIAARLGFERHAISRNRRRLGLPSRAYSERYREKLRAAARRQCEAAGVSNLGQFRALKLREYVARSGWPASVRMRGAQILDLLEARGPLTRREICAELGLPWHGARNSLKSNHPENTYMAHLQRIGLVVRLGRVVKGAYTGGNVNLYALALTAERNQGATS